MRSLPLEIDKNIFPKITEIHQEHFDKKSLFFSVEEITNIFVTLIVVLMDDNSFQTL